MSGYTSFAVAGGSGGLGAFIVSSLARSPNTQVTVLSRSDKPASGNVSTKAVDYTSPSTLESALKGVEVVISTLSGEGFGYQKALARAAKNAGAKLFVPSEFGNVTLDVTEDSLLFMKKDVQNFLKSIDLPYVLVFNGPFTDYIFVPPLGFNFAEGTANLIGKGDTPITFTSRPDVARFLAHALRAFPSSQLANSVLRIEADRKTLNEAIDLYSATHGGKKIQRTYTSIEETEKFIAENSGMASFLQFLLLGWENGKFSTSGTKEELSNGLWKEWNPKSVKEVLADFP